MMVHPNANSIMMGFKRMRTTPDQYNALPVESSNDYRNTTIILCRRQFQRPMVLQHKYPPTHNHPRLSLFKLVFCAMIPVPTFDCIKKPC